MRAATVTGANFMTKLLGEWRLCYLFRWSWLRGGCCEVDFVFDGAGVVSAPLFALFWKNGAWSISDCLLTAADSKAKGMVWRIAIATTRDRFRRAPWRTSGHLHNLFLPAFFALAHLALAAIDIFRRAAADSLRFLRLPFVGAE